MRLFTALKTRQATLVVLAIMMVASTLFAAIYNPFVPEVSAATENECYNKNGNVYVSNESSHRSCLDLGYCKLVQDPSGLGSRLQCSKEVYQAYLDAANNASILNTQTSPVVDIICAGITSSIPRNTCVNDVRQRYVICANGAEEGSPTEEEIGAAIAGCMRTWARTAYPNAQVDLNKLTEAVLKGRSDGNDQAVKIGVEAEKDKCETEGGTWTNGDCIKNTNNTCNGGSLGWLLCPFIAMMKDAIEGTAKLLDELLRLPILDRGTGDGGIYKLWQSILNVANILLVVAFLIVIFSQATSLGLSSYGIKKMLPRIIAAAILMNLSFFICQVLVDFSNILGAGVAQLVQVVTDGETISTTVSRQVGGIEKTVAASVTIAIIAFFFLIPVLLSFLAVFFTIAARFALVILLVLVAPLAFAAWILPNTEKYFQKWWSLFFNLLMLYPIIMLLFAASIIASNAVGLIAQ